MDLPQAAIDLINHPDSHGAIITLNRDGAPQVTLVWIEVLDGKLSFNTGHRYQKLRNLQRDPRIVVMVQDPDNLRDYAAFHGSAVATEEGADDQVDRLAHKYLGVDTYPSRLPDEQRIRVDVNVHRIVGNRPWGGS